MAIFEKRPNLYKWTNKIKWMKMAGKISVTKEIARALALLKAGVVVILPTDTVYALSCDASNEKAVQQLYEIKRRPLDKPLLVLVHSLRQAKEHGAFNSAAEKLSNHFWPGPLTLIVPRRSGSSIAASVCGSNQNIGMRVPRHNILTEVIKRLGQPIIGTSANLASAKEQGVSKQIAFGFEKEIDIVLDDLPLASEQVNALTPHIVRQAWDVRATTKHAGSLQDTSLLVSTIVDCTKESAWVARQGAISSAEIVNVL